MEKKVAVKGKKKPISLVSLKRDVKERHVMTSP